LKGKGKHRKLRMKRRAQKSKGKVFKRGKRGGNGSEQGEDANKEIWANLGKKKKARGPRERGFPREEKTTGAGGRKNSLRLQWWK